jgi:hypothetical protein
MEPAEVLDTFNLKKQRMPNKLSKNLMALLKEVNKLRL